MLNSWDIGLLSLFYLLCLFVIAYLGDRADKAWLNRVKPWVIGLSLTIYCSAWSFYGTTGQAVFNGWPFPPTFIGAMVTLVIAAPFVRRLIRQSKQENSTSIADFIASRYGRSPSLAMVVTIISVIALLPYISLQLKAISTSFNTITQQTSNPNPWQDSALFIAIALALFTILFGTRHIDRNEHHHGLMLAIAFEALIKLAVIVLAAGVVCWGYFDGPGDLLRQVLNDGYVQHIADSRGDDQGFIAALVLGAAAILCLPRQFHALVVESRDEQDLKPAAGILFFYLLIFGLAILPIAYGGLILLQGQGISPEKFAILLPMHFEHESLAVLVYLGGLSAGSSMVIVACIAVATMLSNEIAMPALVRSGRLRGHSDLSHVLRLLRRLSIIILLAMSYGYYRWLGSNEALGSIGLLSMALVAQFLPALLGALYIEAPNPKAAVAGLSLGFLMWTYTLLLPAFGHTGWIDDSFIHHGPWQLDLLKPQQLMGLGMLSPISNGVLWSLGLNCISFIGVSLWFRRQGAKYNKPSINVSRQQLQQLASSFLGAQQAELAVQQYQKLHEVKQHNTEENSDRAEQSYIDYIEKLLAGVIGSTSAHHLIQYASQFNNNRLHSDFELLQETSQIFQFSRSTLQSSIDSISQGISVVDTNKQLVAWNQRYIELFNYPQELVHVGRPVADLIRFNGQSGHFGDTDIEQEIKKRISFLDAATPYVFERCRRDGTVLEIRGTPLPGGGYVTTYTDISDYRSAVNELTEHKQLLEHKVTQRTEALSQSNLLLEQANASKTRFLAAAGHDLAQPLNAARLFTEALRHRNNADLETLDRIAHSIQSAEALIGELLDIAKIDSGAIHCEQQIFPVQNILDSIFNDFHQQAEAKQLQLRCIACSAYTHTDPNLLLRICHNLIANAIRYTPDGKVILGFRRCPEGLQLCIYDTGIGIAENQQEEIFKEFSRLNTIVEEGSGLGLATVKRLAELMELKLTLSSTPNQGSCFRLLLPHASTPSKQEQCLSEQPLQQLSSIKRIVLIENDSEIVIAMKKLLEQWGFEVSHSESLEGLKLLDRPELILADYHLQQGQNGLDWSEQLQHHWQKKISTIIISADRTDEVKQKAQNKGYNYIKKPLKPAALRALIDGL